MKKLKVLLTGASGFIGRPLTDALAKENRFNIVATSRKGLSFSNENVSSYAVDSFVTQDWDSILQGVDVVIHLAAKAHAHPSETLQQELHEVNCEATLQLACRAVCAGVKRFIFISSIGVNGAESLLEPFSESSVPAPHSCYALSKYNAEKGLQNLVSNLNTDMEIVIVRPPLIYAYDAPGNFQKLLNLVHCGIPLPFANVRNSRSFIYRDNLIDFLIKCVDFPGIGGEVFLISDGVDMSTSQLIFFLSQGMNKRARLFPFPVSLIYIAAKAIGKSSLAVQLCGNLQIDASKAFRMLHWSPPISPASGLIISAQKYAKFRASK